MPKKNSNVFDSLGTASVMGLHMVSGPIVGASLGYFADKFLNSSPYGIIIGALLGIAAGYLNVMKDAKHLQTKKNEIENDSTDEEVQNPQEFIEYNLFGEGKTINFKETSSKEEKE